MAIHEPASAAADDPDETSRWWRDGVVYQVYPRSFADSNGDGVGDLAGIIGHLDHLAGGPDSLGVDALWLSPIYPSPMLDGGYDITDYTTVDPVFGTLADLDRLIEECHRRGIRVVLDLVMNHTSDQHPWFVQSRASKTGPFSDFYLWRDPSGWDADGRPEPPNNWLSWFGGTAWEWGPERQQFYLHTFLAEQPDVNWRSDDLRAEMWSMVTGWLDRGVDGFRLDVFNVFVKAADLPSNPVIAPDAADPWDRQEHRYDKDQPELHDLLAEFRGLLDARPGTATVGELFAHGVEAAIPHWAPRHLVFDWVLIETPWSAGAFRAAITEREAAWGDRWPVTVLSNHDQSRHVSRYLRALGRGDAATADALAKAAAALALTLRGTPFLYYGEEIGALDIVVPHSEARDRAARQNAGWWNRDGCRAPMAWSGDRSAGFTTGAPWLPIAPDAESRNVAHQQASDDSILAFYRRLLALRRSSAPLHSGSLDLVDVGDPDVLAYLRRSGDEVALVVVRFGLDGGEIGLPASPAPWKVVLSSQGSPSAGVGSRIALRPLEALVLQPDADTIGG
jgi:alpha-glucosidase